MRIVRVSMSENFVEYCQYVTNENTVCKKLINTQYEILLYCYLQGIIQHQCNKVQLIRLMVSAIACTFIMTLHIKEMIDGILCLKTRKRIVQKVLRVDFQIFSYLLVLMDFRSKILCLQVKNMIQYILIVDGQHSQNRNNSSILFKLLQ